MCARSPRGPEVRVKIVQGRDGGHGTLRVTVVTGRGRTRCILGKMGQVCGGGASDGRGEGEGKNRIL